VRCAVYADEPTFMTRVGIWEGHSGVPAEGVAEFQFSVPAGRRVAVSAFQDIDSDEEFDLGPLGIPSEPWATSGQRTPIGPPSWKRSSFVPDAGGSAITIRLAGGRPAEASGDVK
jgi:uncharacterized protein (DUF2141 family)